MIKMLDFTTFVLSKKVATDDLWIIIIIILNTE